MMKPSERKWRTLVRVIALTPTGAWFAIPGWNPGVSVFIRDEDIPSEIGKLEVDRRLHVRCNIGCERADMLEFSDWEPN